MPNSDMHRLVTRSEMTADDDGTFTGRLVPYGVPIELADGLWEQMEPGVFARQVGAPDRVKVRHEHGEVIGHFVELDERDDGLWGTGRIVDTSRGRDTLALMRAGSVDQLSVGFVPRDTDRVAHDGGTLLVRNSGTLRECSVVWAGAYAEHAAIATVRTADPSARQAALERLRNLTA